MRRQKQERGVKLWSGNDLLDLQNECLKICDGFLGQFGSGILSGCNVQGSNISEGLVFLDGRVIPFYGANVASFPVYLKTRITEDKRYYADGSYQAIAEEYEAEAVTSMPAENCITLNATGNPTFFELLQNDSRLFFTKAERDKLAGIEALANKIIVDSALSDSSTNPVQNKVVKAALDGKAENGHVHNYAGSASAGGAANSVAYPLTLQLNGVNQDAYNGSAARTVNITAGNIGAATSTHTHNYAGSASAGGAANSVAGALTLQLNGVSQTAYNGSVSQTINVTAGSIGAAETNHNHNYAGSASVGGPATSVANSLDIQFNSVSQGTYNGAATRTINITPERIKAAEKEHEHKMKVSSSSSQILTGDFVVFESTSEITRTLPYEGDLTGKMFIITQMLTGKVNIKCGDNRSKIYVSGKISDSITLSRQGDCLILVYNGLNWHGGFLTNS